MSLKRSTPAPDLVCIPRSAQEQIRQNDIITVAGASTSSYQESFGFLCWWVIHITKRDAQIPETSYYCCIKCRGGERGRAVADQLGKIKGNTSVTGSIRIITQYNVPNEVLFYQWTKFSVEHRCHMSKHIEVKEFATLSAGVCCTFPHCHTPPSSRIYLFSSTLSLCVTSCCSARGDVTHTLNLFLKVCGPCPSGDMLSVRGRANAINAFD